MQREKSFSGIGWLRSLAFFFTSCQSRKASIHPDRVLLVFKLSGKKKKKWGAVIVFYLFISHTVWRLYTQTRNPVAPASRCTRLFQDKGKDEERRAPCGCWLCAELAAASQRQRGQDGKQLLCLPAPSRRYNAGRIRAKRIKSQHRNFYCRYRLQIADQHACVALGPVLSLSLSCDGTDVKNCSKFYPE